VFLSRFWGVVCVCVCVRSEKVSGKDGEDLLHWSWLCRGSNYGDDRLEVSQH
jgi:hypothetical protein